MSYREPMVIREPDLRWPIYLIAAIITTLFVLLLAGVLHLSVRQPLSRGFNEPQLERAIRPGAPEFEQLREQIVVEQLVAMEALHPFNDMAVEMNATVRNATGRTVSGLEMRGTVLDAQSSRLRERTVVVIPARQTALEPDEAINVRILLEGISPDLERAGVLMEVTGVHFD
ncbi:MAG TPA: hypothetical protein VGX92_10910 [Pyrinomonadaceae bacterium]|nr:hypothetical protein [Pyrinomonadaceae bacterium]